MKFRITRRILQGRKTVGYEVIDNSGNYKNLSIQEVKQFCKSGAIEGIKLDTKTDSIQGDTLDLRTLKSVQYSELTKNKLEKYNSIEDNKVYYEKIKTGEIVAYVRTHGHNILRLSNIQADTLIVYRAKGDNSSRDIRLDTNSIRIKHLVFLNIQDNLFDMVQNFLRFKSKAKVISEYDGSKCIKATLDFIDTLKQLNYIRDDDYQAIPGVQDVRYFETNVNLFLGNNITNREGFYFQYRKIIEKLKLNLSKYMRKLYSDHAVRQIVDGTIKIRYKGNQVSTFINFERQLKFIKPWESILSYKITNSTKQFIDHGPDALIEADLETVIDIVKNCKDFDILRKLAIPSMQVVKLVVNKRDTGRDTGRKQIFLELYRFKDLYSSNLVRTDEILESIGTSQRVEEISKRLIPLEQKLRLLTSSVGGNDKVDKIISSKIVRYLLDLYKSDETLWFELPKLLIYLSYKYCRNSLDNIDNSLSINHIGSLLDVKTFDDINLSQFLVQYTQTKSLIDKPELSIFITHLWPMFMKDELQREGLDIHKFNFSDYDFRNLMKSGQLFGRCQLDEVILDSISFPRLLDISDMFNSANIDKLVIKNIDFQRIYRCVGMFSEFIGKALILNCKFNDDTKGLLASFEDDFGVELPAQADIQGQKHTEIDINNREHVIYRNMYNEGKGCLLLTDSPELKYYRENEFRACKRDGGIFVPGWMKYKHRYSNYGDYAVKQKLDYSKIHRTKFYVVDDKIH